MNHTTNQPKGSTMNNLTLKSRRNAYSIVGKEVTATSARSAAEQAGIDWTVSLADLQALATAHTAALVH